MPNYLPATYQPGWGYSGTAQPMYQQYQPTPVQQSYGAQAATKGIDWVDGEAEAKGRQMPPGVTQYAMWDINEPIIYIKSLNQMGMPNPLRKAKYQLEDNNMIDRAQQNASGFSGDTEPKMNPADYVRKDDMERMKQELMDAIGSMGTQETHGNQTAKPSGRVAKGE